MSYKKFLLIALMVGGLSTTISFEAQARPNGHGPKVMKMLFKDVGLNDAQKETLKAMRPSKEERQAKKGDGKERSEWMQDFASGRMSRAQVIQGLEKKVSIRQDFHQEKLESMLDFLSTLTEQQKEQVLRNLDALQEKKEARQSKREERRANNPKAGGKDKKMKRMFDGIALSSSQERLMEKLQAFHEERRAEKQSKKFSKHDAFAEFLSGERSQSQILASVSQRRRAQFQNRKIGAGLWMDILESLSSDQQDQLFDNLDDLKQERRERMEQRKEKRKDRRKSRRNRGE